MNYIGSKFKLSNWIKKEIHSVVGKDLSNKVFADLFAGTGAVSRTLKKDVSQVIANDLEKYSYILNRNYIGNYQIIDSTSEIIDELNNLPLEDGFIFKNYCLGGGQGRQYFKDNNGRKIDAIRNAINKFMTNKEITEDCYYFLLASLLESADKVANTASVYGAFLKQIKKSAEKDLILEPANFDLTENAHQVFQKDANKLIKEISGDILYLDPPYNSRQYGANYHLLNTIAEYDSFMPKGKTGLREYLKSKYCSKVMVEQEFEALIRQANFKYIFLSYNNEGLMSESKIRQIFSQYGKYDLVTTGYQRFKADRTENRNYKASSTTEYLHILEKNE
ncbi:modification methylase [Rodentibacter trehalosifermentans]|uniref:site-specific DNA-methyltransferase (adenine-specific) n=1 Tax=Rodentibacter trehalosifermentans TaxID=1908263 RepID=A0A1V3J328_9PAST|nr:DNA adenine methylase [Rodentibacter trehalosifermentans]OOF47178.1 modification methylase [Rodentibacter trehalosifermentans]OOF49498.1 modification methylase [Rodentibacter trehalosifermentans]